MKRKLKFIGITGGVGAGKTELLRYIQAHYRCEVYLADRVAEGLQQPGQPCFQALVALLGPQILTREGALDRGKLSERIFRDPGLLAQVNSIVHPAVKEYLLRAFDQVRAQGEKELFFVEAALLIEGGYRQIADELWYVYAREEIRRERLRRLRGYGEEKIERIMGNQLSDKAFRESCDFVIDNSGSLEESCRQIDKKLEAFTWQE